MLLSIVGYMAWCCRSFHVKPPNVFDDVLRKNGVEQERAGH